MEKNTLTVDVSTQSTTAAVFDLTGKKLSVKTIPHKTYGKGPVSEQDPEEWWRNILTTAKTLNLDDVSAVVADGTPYGVIPVDKAGKLLTRAIIYTDKRAQDEARDIGDMPEFQGLKFHKANPTHPIPKILWMKRNRPEIYDKTATFHTCTSYINFRLTGECFTDTWENFRRYADPKTGKLPTKMLNTLSLDANKFPTAYPIGSKTYPIKPDIAAAIGLPKDAKAVLATNDSGLAVIGSGINEPGETSLSFGTAAVVKTLTDRRISDPKSGIWPQPAEPIGKWIIGGYEMAGAVLEWHKRKYYANKDNPYEAMNKDADSTSPGAGGLIFKPYLYGSRCPRYDPGAKAEFVGETDMTSRAERTRAVYDSLAHIVKDILDATEDAGQKTKDIRASGGLTQSDTLMQIVSDVTGKKISILAEKDTTNLGGAIVAAAATGIYPDIRKAQERMIRTRKVHKPDRAKQRKYRALFERWKTQIRSI